MRKTNAKALQNNKGITLITLIMTVIILLIIAGLSINYGINTYKSSKVMKFETYMKILQKKVDIMIEEGIDYTTVGTALTNGQKDRLQAIMPTIDTSEPQLRYFSSDNIEEVFDVPEVYDEIVINFANRDVISLNGVEKNGVMHYVEYTLH